MRKSVEGINGSNGGIYPFRQVNRIPEDILPPDLRPKLKAGRTIFQLASSLRQRIPVYYRVPDERSGLMLDNDTVDLDALMWAAEKAVSLYRNVASAHDPYFLREDFLEEGTGVDIISQGEHTLRDAVGFLENMRKLVPQLLEKSTAKAAHPSAVISLEGILALSFLSEPRGQDESIDDYRLRRRYAKRLLREDVYAGRLYRQNKGLFNGIPRKASAYTGQYL